MKIVLVINGPNLGILGKRQTHIYGLESLNEINKKLKKKCEEIGILIHDFQHNSEGKIISFLNENYLSYYHSSNKNNKLIGIIINPAAYSHTSIGIRDSLEVYKEEKIPIFEVHISNIFARENFRQISYISPIATGTISGLGSYGYEAALNKIIELEDNA